jgi:predicted RNA binding protein YcfA (HicA-like mRNA interferase family)
MKRRLIMATHSGQDYVKAAKKNGLQVEMGKGDHCKVYAPADRGYMTIPLHKELARGTDCAIKKWFKALGILLALGSMACLALSYLSQF